MIRIIFRLLMCAPAWMFSTANFAQAPADSSVQNTAIPITVTEVAPGLFFQYHHQGSNNAWLVTDEGVLVIDARQHPKRAEELLTAIRKAMIAVTVTTLTASSFSAARFPAFPDLPTNAESGVPGVDFYLWQAMLAPAGLSRATLAQLNGELNKALGDAEVKTRMTQQGNELMGGTPREATAFISAEIARWRKIIKPEMRIMR